MGSIGSISFWGVEKMEKRRKINESIVEWIVNKVKTEYVDDISLVLIYGSYVNGTANSKSDVDCYYIPKTERGYSLGMGFMIDGVGYDIFPIPWERVERIADLEESLSPLVGDAEIIYCNSASDEERFQAMQDRLKNNLQNDKYVRKIAVKRCEEASKYCAILKQTNKETEIRKIAGYIIMTLADAVAVHNHDYYHFGLKKQFENLKNNFPNVPQTIVEGYENVVKATYAEDVIKHTMQLLHDVCEYLDITYTEQEVLEEERASASKVDAACLAGLYEEISSTFNKIYVCCESGNYILAFLSAVCLQRDLDDAREVGCPAYDLLSGFNYEKLGELSIKAHEIENDFIKIITENGGHIKEYATFEQFKLAKS